MFIYHACEYSQGSPGNFKGASHPAQTGQTSVECSKKIFDTIA